MINVVSQLVLTICKLCTLNPSFPKSIYGFPEFLKNCRKFHGGRDMNSFGLFRDLIINFQWWGKSQTDKLWTCDFSGKTENH